MPRITVRVDVPAGANDLAALMQKIIDQDAALNLQAPGSSPINPKDIAAMKAIVAAVKPDQDLIEKLQPQLEAAIQRSEKALGLADGQNVRTEGTGLFLVTKIRDVLQAEYKGNEKEMEGYGYNVVMGSAAAPKPRAKKTP